MRKPDRTFCNPCTAVVAATLLGCAIGACRPATSTESAPPATAAPVGGGVHGLKLASIDRAVQPGDDFYKFGNGAWLAKTEIPADRSTWGPSEAMTEEAALRTRGLLEQAATASPATGCSC